MPPLAKGMSEGDLPSKVSEAIDTFYIAKGPCCAGCDWWAPFNSVVGECRSSAPVAAEQRAGPLGVTASSAPLYAGHILTFREHHCGDFADTFDWASLPAAYRRRIGMG